jgi:hypothetical protein
MQNSNAIKSSNQPATSVSDDVLHIPAVSKMTPEEIAKAVAHHNKHSKEKPGKVEQQAKSGKKSK